MRRALLAALALCVASTLAVPSTAEAAPAIKIYRVQFDSPGSDTSSNLSLNNEWVQVKNVSSTTRSLTGWTLRDRQGFVYTFPSFTLRPGAVVTVRTGKGTATATNRYYNRTWYVWNNTGDTAYLRSSTGALIHSCTAGAAAKYC